MSQLQLFLFFVTWNLGVFYSSSLSLASNKSSVVKYDYFLFTASHMWFLTIPSLTRVWHIKEVERDEVKKDLVYLFSPLLSLLPLIHQMLQPHLIHSVSPTAASGYPAFCIILNHSISCFQHSPPGMPHSSTSVILILLCNYANILKATPFMVKRWFTLLCIRRASLSALTAFPVFGYLTNLSMIPKNYN